MSLCLLSEIFFLSISSFKDIFNGKLYKLFIKYKFCRTKNKGLVRHKLKISKGTL